MNSLDAMIYQRPPTAARPLLGVTVLVVEDSRYACEALRLMCLKSGARIRRADSLAAARKHLATFRPSVVIVDLGLPDGDGRELIADLSQAKPRVDVILATSGDPDALDRVEADGTLAKPFTDLATFQNAILSHFPPERVPRGPRALPREDVRPEDVALRDDLTHVATLLTEDADGATLGYAGQFLASVAQSAEDSEMQLAAQTLAARQSDLARRNLAGLVAARLDTVRGAI